MSVQYQVAICSDTLVGQRAPNGITVCLVMLTFGTRMTVLCDWSLTTLHSGSRKQRLGNESNNLCSPRN